MPTYDYKCAQCGITLETYSSVSEQTAPRCDCGEVMQKVFTAIPTIFKGTGWAGKS